MNIPATTLSTLRPFWPVPRPASRSLQLLPQPHSQLLLGTSPMLAGGPKNLPICSRSC